MALVTLVTASELRLARGVAVSGCCGSHVSAGTPAEVLIARSSAQSLAKERVYFARVGRVPARSISTARTTRLAVRPAEADETASRSPGHTSPCSSAFHSVYL